MRRKTVSRILIVLSALGFSLITQSKIAVGEEVSTSTASNNTFSATEAFTSDGSVIEIPKADAKITPPKNWEVNLNSPGLSAVFQEPELSETEMSNIEKNLKKDETAKTYRRNMSIAVMHHPSPIDSKRAEQLEEEIRKTLGERSIISNLEFMEHKFFDFKNAKDGIVMYVRFKMGEFDMMQMYVLVSGEDKHYLMTYSDLAERFSSGDFFNQAWNSMVSLEVVGVAPQRYLKTIIAGSILLVILGLSVIFSIIRRRKATKGYMEDADQIYNEEAWDQDKEMPITQTGVWRLSSQGKLDFNRPGKKNSSDIFAFDDVSGENVAIG